MVRTPPSDKLREARESALVASIRRKERLQAWGDYVGFAVTKGGGLATLLVSGLELLNPNILPLQLTQHQSETALGVGLALLGGTKLISLIAKVTNALK